MKTRWLQFVWLVIAIFAMVSFMGCQNQTPNIRSDNGYDTKTVVTAGSYTVSDITFNEHFPDANKPEHGFFASKYWIGGRPQIMCYNKATRDDIPAALLMAMIDDINARIPVTKSELEDGNFRRREWSLTDYGSAPTTTVVPVATEVQKVKVEKEAAPTSATPATASSLSKRVKALEKKNLYEDVEARVKALGFESIKGFQIAEGLKADGIPGPKTLWMLRRAEALPRIKVLGYDTFYQFQDTWGIKKDNLWGNESETTLIKAEDINKKYSVAIKNRLGKDVEAFQCQYNLFQRGSVDPGTKAQADKTLGLLDDKRSKEIVESAPTPACQ